jgi:hypothetical protein
MSHRRVLAELHLMGQGGLVPGVLQAAVRLQYILLVQAARLLYMQHYTAAVVDAVRRKGSTGTADHCHYTPARHSPYQQLQQACSALVLLAQLQEGLTRLV